MTLIPLLELNAKYTGNEKYTGLNSTDIPPRKAGFEGGLKRLKPLGLKATKHVQHRKYTKLLRFTYP